MPDFILTVLYRPLYQQWILFVVFSLCIFALESVFRVLPVWKAWKTDEDSYQQQYENLKKQQGQLASLPPLQQLREQLLNPGDAEQPETVTPDKLLAGSNITVKRWVNTSSPVELQLQLRWEEVKPLFEKMALPYPQWLPVGFTLGVQGEGLEMTLWLRAGE